MKMTNADRIRQMSDEEMAELLTCIAGCGMCANLEDPPSVCVDACGRGHLAWLKKEAD